MRRVVCVINRRMINVSTYCHEVKTSLLALLVFVPLLRRPLPAWSKPSTTCSPGWPPPRLKTATARKWSCSNLPPMPRVPARKLSAPNWQGPRRQSRRHHRAAAGSRLGRAPARVHRRGGIGSRPDDFAQWPGCGTQGMRPARLGEEPRPGRHRSLRAALKQGGETIWKIGLIQSLGERGDAESVSLIAPASASPRPPLPPLPLWARSRPSRR